MMKMHWSPRSPFVRKVMIAIHEMGLEKQVECTRTVVAPTKVSEELMRDNPLSKLPTLVLEDGAPLYDSRVICEVLDARHNRNKLFPSDLSERTIALRQQSLGDGLMDFALLWLIEKQRGPGMQSEPLIAAFRAKLAASLDRLETDIQFLTHRPFDIGHVTIGTALGYFDFRFADQKWRDGHSKLAGWHASFVQRPSVLANPVVDDS